MKRNYTQSQGRRMTTNLQVAELRDSRQISSTSQIVTSGQLYFGEHSRFF
uniref:Uncharacterized protein n=1 Tax=Anguilla anguilla TaxID=7936 RepID=A0A0E9VF80_ANGAN